MCSGTLTDYIKGKYDGPKFKSEKEILFQATQGVAYLHRLKIVHRDIKPNNILIYLPDGISGKPQIKVADFGISILLKVDQEDFTNSSQSNPSGTRGWIAPEAHDQKRCDFKVDTWALGLIFCYTLSDGKHPFGEDLDKRSSLIKEKGPMLLVRQDLKEPYSQNPEAFKLIQFMLTPDPNKRPLIADIESSPFFLMDPVVVITIILTTI